MENEDWNQKGPEGGFCGWGILVLVIQEDLNLDCQCVSEDQV